MPKKERAVIFPLDMESAPVVRYNKLLVDYEVVGVVVNSPFLEDEDVNYFDGGSSMDIEKRHDLSCFFDHCDAVIFADSLISDKFDEMIYPKMLEAIDAGKNIVCLINLEADVKNKIEELCDSKNLKFTYHGKDKKVDFAGREKGRSLLKISTPVIFILGVSEMTNKFSSQLSMRKNILEQGYKVSQVGTRHYCEIFGFHSFPGFMFDSNISEEDKILMFNLYIKGIELDEKPDVIIIGIPGGIMPISDKFVNRFGITAFEVSQAMLPDISLLSIQFEGYTPDYFKLMSNLIRHKLGFEVDCYNLANIKLDMTESDQWGELVFRKVDTELVEDTMKTYKELTVPVFNLMDEPDSYNASCYIMDKLADYAEIQVL